MMSLFGDWLKAVLCGALPISIGLLCLLKPHSIREKYIQHWNKFPGLSKLNPFASPEFTESPLMLLDIVVGGALLILFGMFTIYLLAP